jgi:hypothetical protein
MFKMKNLLMTCWLELKQAVAEDLNSFNVQF